MVYALVGAIIALVGFIAGAAVATFVEYGGKKNNLHK
jgi:multisubunit Na+/H+ antiporter MnhF subunit